MKTTITIPVADETTAFWLVSMFEKEAEDADGAASNERLWAKGSDGEAAEMHLENARLNAEYAELLKKAKADVEKYWSEESNVNKSKQVIKNCGEV